jgi:DNA polymerase-3 subunit gamma/tau
VSEASQSSSGPVSLALYRKYRSATFAEVIGQEHITTPLSTALSAGRINHAYLFSGPRGCGKTSSARILARSLNCIQGPTPTPCGVCDSCKELAPNGPGSIDVIEIDAASHGGVDDARDLRERAYYAPVRDRYKVYIIDEAHMVTPQGFNALLKLVEEPPDFLVFIFATTEPDKVLQTIRSRTHHYPFRLIPPGVLRTHLERICTAEGVAIEPAVLPLVVRAGGGSARDSLSLLDQLLAGAGADGVTYASAVALLGVTDAALLDDIIDALAVGDSASVYATVDRVVEAGHEPRRFAADLLDRLRDLLVLDAVPEAAGNGLINAPTDSVARMSEQAMRIGGATAARWAEIVHTALTDMRGTTAPRLVLELVCARMLLPDASADAAALLQRLERVERRLDLAGAVPATPRPPAPSVPFTPSEAPPARAERAAAPPRPAEPASRPEPIAPAPDPTPVPAPASAAVEVELPERVGPPPVPPAPSPPQVSPAPVSPPPADGPAGVIDAAALRSIWPSVVEKIKESSRVTHALMETVQVAGVQGNEVQLVIATPAFVSRLSEARHADVIAAAVGALVAGSWTITVALVGSLATAGERRPAPTSAPPASKPSPSASPPSPTDGAWPDVTHVPDPEADPASVPAAAEANQVSRDDDPRDDDPRDEGPDSDDATTTARHDPEADALALLQSGLGARKVE